MSTVLIPTLIRWDYKPGQNILGRLRKLDTKTHFVKWTHILPLKKAWECCYESLFLLSHPLHGQAVLIVLERQHCTVGEGRWKIPHFDELLRLCPKRFSQGCRFGLTICRWGIWRQYQRVQFLKSLSIGNVRQGIKPETASLKSGQSSESQSRTCYGLFIQP